MQQKYIFYYEKLIIIYRIIFILKKYIDFYSYRNSLFPFMPAEMSRAGETDIYLQIKFKDTQKVVPVCPAQADLFSDYRLRLSEIPCESLRRPSMNHEDKGISDML